MEYLSITIRIKEELQISNLNRIGDFDETLFWLDTVEKITLKKLGKIQLKLKLFSMKNL